MSQKRSDELRMLTARALVAMQDLHNAIEAVLDNVPLSEETHTRLLKVSNWVRKCEGQVSQVLRVINDERKAIDK